MKILLILHTYAADGEFGSFALQLVEGFANTGAEVHVIKANDLVDGLGATALSSELDKNKIKSYFTRNKFDLVFNTNHAGMGGLIKKYIGQAPVISWLVDRNPFLHAGKNNNKLFSKTTHVITSSRANVDNLIYKFNLKEDNIHYLPFMTNPLSFNDKINKSINICFIGSFFVNEKVVSQLLLRNYKNKYYLRVLDALSSLEDDFDQDDESLVKEIGLCSLLKKQKISPSRFKGAIGNIISNKKRLDYLSEVSDLGLHLYGTDNISSLATHSPSLASCFQSSYFVNSRERLCNIYDRSKIGLNINHHQATTGLSYRVFDILASSALLVTNKQRKSDLEYLFGADHPVPIYSTSRELKTICKHFLQYESEREQLIQECNQLVAEEHTFDQRAIDLIRIAYPKFAVQTGRSMPVTFIQKNDLVRDDGLMANKRPCYNIKEMIHCAHNLVSRH